MSAMTPEGKIKKKLTDMLKHEKVWYFLPAANGMGRAGIPDVIAIVEGQFIGIECKADAAKKPTALQMECAKQIRNAGGYWFLIFDDYSTADLQTWIQKWKNR
jgi:hypothetical protein